MSSTSVAFPSNTCINLVGIEPQKALSPGCIGYAHRLKPGRLTSLLRLEPLCGRALVERRMAYWELETVEP
jgi:hypothetical protein